MAKVETKKKKKKRLYHHWKHTQELKHQKRYKSYSKKLNIIISNEKDTHYRTSLKNASHSKDKWNLLNSLLGKQKRKNVIYSLDKNIKEEPATVIVKKFAEHFALIFNKIQSIKPTAAVYNRFFCNFMFLSQTNAVEVRNVLKSLKTNCSHLEKNIPIKIWKNRRSRLCDFSTLHQRKFRLRHIPKFP